MTYICVYFASQYIDICSFSGHKLEKYQAFDDLIIKTIPTKLFCQDA